ncbi:hypothetical protein LXL04_011241 [Taraxacum kok-saghyz]
MKVFVKTLKGTQFEIEVKLNDKVVDVKKNIETVKGPDVYPAARQMLIHDGKVLDDDITVEEYKISENSFMVIMLSKVITPSPSAPPPTPVAAPPPDSPPSDDPIDRVYRILYMHGASSRFDFETISDAVNDADNDPELAVELLYLGIQEPPPSVNPPPAPPTGPNANPLNLFLQDRRRRAGTGGTLDFLRDIPRFQGARYRVRCHPQILQPIIQQFARNNPELAGLIHEHREELVRMISEPFEDEEEVEIEPLKVDMTSADGEAIDRLAAMGFNWSLAFNMYFACDKNEQMAANYLLDNMDGSNDSTS